MTYAEIIRRLNKNYLDEEVHSKYNIVCVCGLKPTGEKHFSLKNGEFSFKNRKMLEKPDIIEFDINIYIDGYEDIFSPEDIKEGDTVYIRTIMSVYNLMFKYNNEYFNDCNNLKQWINDYFNCPLFKKKQEICNEISISCNYYNMIFNNVILESYNNDSDKQVHTISLNQDYVTINL